MPRGCRSNRSSSLRRPAPEAARIIARAVQSIITKHKLVEQPIVVTNKGGGSGAEGYTYTKAMAGDPYKIVFGTSNAWTQPMVSKVAYNYTDLTPIAAMVQDEFLLMGWSGRAPAPPAS